MRALLYKQSAAGLKACFLSIFKAPAKREKYPFGMENLQNKTN